MPDNTERGVLGSLAPRAYDDTLAPALRAVGESLGHTVRTALRPVEGILWTIDQAFDWVAERATARLASQKVERRTVHSPTIEIESQVLLGVQVAGPLNDGLLRNLFAALLATAMSTTESTEVHPSFPHILRQLAVDEARLVALLASRPGLGVAFARVEAGWRPENRENEILVTPNESQRLWESRTSRPLEDELGLRESYSLSSYLGHLKSLGLVEVEAHESEAGLQRLFKADHSHSQLWHEFLEFIGEMQRKQKACHVQIAGTGELRAVEFFANVSIQTVRLSSFGHDFASACGAGEFWDPFNRAPLYPDWAQ